LVKLWAGYWQEGETCDTPAMLAFVWMRGLVLLMKGIVLHDEGLPTPLNISLTLLLVTTISESYKLKKDSYKLNYKATIIGKSKDVQTFSWLAVHKDECG
jgi:hypothetical protein